MSSTFALPSGDSFDTVYSHLKRLPTPLLPPGKSHDPSLTDRIASLYVHPTLEALLHILNHDLPSAHFLVRHMQSPPAVEGMYTHGLLHRIEGDYDNCRAWYADVCSTAAFVSFWPDGDDARQRLDFLSEEEIRRFGGDVHGDEGSGEASTSVPKVLKTVAGKKVPSQLGPRAFVSAVQDLKSRALASEGYAQRKKDLEVVSRAEIEALVQFCAEKYGKYRLADASAAWVRHGEEIKQTGERMVSGDEGHRKF